MSRRNTHFANFGVFIEIPQQTLTLQKIFETKLNYLAPSLLQAFHVHSGGCRFALIVAVLGLGSSFTAFHIWP